MTRAELLKRLQRMITALGDKPVAWRTARSVDDLPRTRAVVAHLTRGYVTPRELGVIFGFGLGPPRWAQVRRHSVKRIDFDGETWVITGEALVFSVEEWVKGFDDGLSGADQIGNPKTLAKVVNEIELHLSDFEQVREVEP